MSHPEVSDVSKDDIFQHVVADFRGLILSEEAVNFPYDKKLFVADKPPSWGMDASYTRISAIEPEKQLSTNGNLVDL
jgi:hypothetical protein